MVDLKKGKTSPSRKKTKSPSSIFQLPLDKAIVRVKGKGKRKLALLSDPNVRTARDLRNSWKA